MRGKDRSAEHQLGMTHKERAEPVLGVPGIWRSRGYLPHYDDLTKMQSITFRLADSLPQSKLILLKEELEHLPEREQGVERRRRIEQWLDSGMGCCALKHPDVAKTMQESLLRFDGHRYHLLAWCIMPNHVHVLIRPLTELGKIVQSWKSYTGRWALKHNAELGLGVPGNAFWMREYWDRYIRDEQHYTAVIKYIHNNPVKAGLCKIAEEWSWSGMGAGTPSTSSAKE